MTGGAATTASVSISAFCIDSSGSIFFADGLNDVIRKISPDGTINRYAGSGIGGYSGDGGNALAAKLNLCQGVAVAPNGDIFIGDVGNNRIRMVTTHLVNVIDETKIDDVLMIFPNPASNIITITLRGKDFKEADAIIFTPDGHIIKTICLKNDSSTQVLTNWPSGTYVIRLVTSFGIYSQIFTKY